MTIEPRLMSGTDAAAYLGITPATFAAWVATGRAPKSLPGTRRWDRKALDMALDKLSGIQPVPTSAKDAEDIAADEWFREYEARQSAQRAAEAADPNCQRWQAERMAGRDKRRSR